MSFSDLKHSLRKYDFPACAKEALIKIEMLLVGRAAPTNKQLDVAMDIISEFVFCETDRRGNRRGLNPLQELQLIDIICDYISACTNETTKNTIFLSLFGSMESQRKLKILSILASMAVSASSTPVLLAVGVWLQQMGSSSPQSLQLVENVIRDHFYLNTSNQTALKVLAKTAPQFVSNFITAVTELYMHDLQRVKKMPPKNLLEIITAWVYSNPTLCMSAQLNPASLPNGSIPMGAVTPLAGLIHWCALAPLYIDEDTEIEELPIKRIKLEDEKLPIIKSVPSKSFTEAELYVKLHLGVLHSLRAGRRTHGPPTAVNAQHLAALTPLVQNYAHQLLKCGVKLQNDTKLQDCLDRMGQSVQVALANGCVYGNISNLLAALDTLPENRLLRIIIKCHQQSI
ncbi:integrator complex subunit 15 [Bicyclus anynana]|uniref:Integrator complex subunit 15 n=1 Tax=Bicyclus anynana TaxID=110368 RepID=A0A6J1MT32_BICAN|nr:integrator complex subunit 15 [Bicyclus anynana]